MHRPTPSPANQPAHLLQLLGRLRQQPQLLRPQELLQRGGPLAPEARHCERRASGAAWVKAAATPASAPLWRPEGVALLLGGFPHTHARPHRHRHPPNHTHTNLSTHIHTRQLALPRSIAMPTHLAPRHGPSKRQRPPPRKLCRSPRRPRRAQQHSHSGSARSQWWWRSGRTARALRGAAGTAGRGQDDAGRGAPL